MSFWDSSLKELRKIPADATVSENRKKSTAKFTAHDISFKSFNRSISTGTLYVPHDVSKPSVVIVIPDYTANESYPKHHLEKSVAYFFLNLKGHDLFVKPTKDEEQKSPGYMIESITDRDNYYVKGVYLDAFRSIDILRMRNFLDCGSMGIIGKGIGAAAAIFAASRSERVKALVLDTPSFAQLPLSQNISESPAANEINDYLRLQKSRTKSIKKNLTYFDAINFADLVSCPVMVTVGFRDKISPPECIFGLFNRLNCDKTMEAYPDQGNEAGGDGQFRKSLEWIIERIKEASRVAP